MNEYCIIGAGLSGIILGTVLEDAVIVEKSRGVGGRIASRRLGPHSVDLGPSSHWWLKDYSKGVTIYREWEVSFFQPDESYWQIHSTTGEKISAKKIILTPPAPQAKAILSKSGFEAPFLDEVQYKSEIQFMILADYDADLTGLNQWLDVKKFSMTERGEKLSLYKLKPEYVNTFLQMTKENIRDFFLTRIKGKVLDSHAHKWKYSETEKGIHTDFQLNFKSKNIFLMGDYFGVSGIQTSLMSAERLFKELNGY